MAKPKVSVVITARNEYPVILSTMMSFWEELQYWGYPFEIIVVDNMSTDNTPEILEDKFRRWIREGWLRVIRYKEKPANVLVRNIGVENATGEVCVLCDAHLSVKVGTVHAMVCGWQQHGGLWHTSTNIWGDTSDIRCYGYKLKLEEKFWGNLSRHIPDEALNGPQSIPPGLEQQWGEDLMRPYRVPMASHCGILVGREEFLKFGGYHDKFRCYGGGEPYLDLLWWTMGSQVWIEPRGLFRHAFGHRPRWEKVKKDRKSATNVLVKGKGITNKLVKGDEILKHSRGYGFTNEYLHFNFMLAAYSIGGYPWLEKMYRVYWEQRKINPRYIRDLKELRRQVLSEGAEKRQWIAANQTMTLDAFLDKKPWVA